MSQLTTSQAFTANLAKKLLRCPAVSRNRATHAIWLKVMTLLLLLPVYWWVVTVIPPFVTQEFTAHILEEGEHCDDCCQHLSSLIDKPQPPVLHEFNAFELLPFTLLIAVLPLDHVARDRPPPLFYSLSHSLRAPPTLIPA